MGSYVKSSELHPQFQQLDVMLGLQQVVHILATMWRGVQLKLVQEQTLWDSETQKKQSRKTLFH